MEPNRENHIDYIIALDSCRNLKSSLQINNILTMRDK